MPLAPRAVRAPSGSRRTPSSSRRAPSHDLPRASTVLPRLLVGIAVLYAVLLLAFWLIHYEGRRPAAGRVVSDFHAFLGFGPDEAEAAPPPVPQPEPEPVKPRVEAPKPPPPPPPPPTRSRLDTVADTIREVEREAKSVKALSRGGELEAARLTLVSKLTDARDVLNEILDANPDDYRANGLWDKLQRVLVALRKL